MDAARASPGASIAIALANTDNTTIFKPLPVIWKPPPSPYCWRDWMKIARTRRAGISPFQPVYVRYITER